MKIKLKEYLKISQSMINNPEFISFKFYIDKKYGRLNILYQNEVLDDLIDSFLEENYLELKKIESILSTKYEDWKLVDLISDTFLTNKKSNQSSNSLVQNSYDGFNADGDFNNQKSTGDNNYNTESKTQGYNLLNQMYRISKEHFDMLYEHLGNMFLEDFLQVYY